MPIIIDPAMRAKAVDMLRQGERPVLIAKLTGIKVNTIYTIRHVQRQEARRLAELETARRLEAELCAGDAQNAGAVEADLPPPAAPAAPMDETLARRVASLMDRQRLPMAEALYQARRYPDQVRVRHVRKHEAFAP